jgi:hypothetical protein
MKPQGISLFKKENHQAIADYYESAVLVFNCTKKCKTANDCDYSCKKWEMVIIFLLLFTFQSFAQQGSKAVYSEKKPVTEETLTKNAQIFDTFVESGKHVYYQKKVKKDGSVEDYYFIVVEAKDKKGNSVLRKKKIYIYETNQN